MTMTTTITNYYDYYSKDGISDNEGNGVNYNNDDSLIKNARTLPNDDQSFTRYR